SSGKRSQRSFGAPMSWRLLLHHRTVALIDGTERLARRNRRAQLVQVPWPLRLGRLLHLEEVHRVKLAAVLADAAFAEQGIVGGQRLHLRDHLGAVVALQRVD